MRRGLAIVALLLQSACSGGGQSAQPGAEAAPAGGAGASKILLRGIGNEPDSLDTQRARTFEAHTVLRDICEPLLTLDASGAPVPGAAARWQVSDDGKTYVFELRPRLRWSNGDAVLAADFVAGLQRLVDPAVASAYAEVIAVVRNALPIVAGRESVQALGVRALDERHVEIDLETPAAYLTALLSHPSTCPVHRATLAKNGDVAFKPGVAVGNGAFVLREWVQGSYILLERNANYWNAAATQLDAVRYIIGTDDNAEFNRYRAGALHITGSLPRNRIDEVRRDYANDLHQHAQLGTYFLAFSLDREPFRDRPGIRRALSMTLDRERITESVTRAGELPAYGWVPPGVHDYDSQSFDYRDWPASRRLAEARRLLREAGFGPSRPLRFTLLYNNGDMHARLAVAAASMWKEALGAEVSLRGMEFKALMNEVDIRAADMFRLAWIGDYNDAWSFLQYFNSSFGVNLTRYGNPAYDALLARAANEPAGRRALLEQAERMLLADHPLIPVYFYVNKHLVRPEVRGWYDNVMDVCYSKDLSLQ
ncbi:MAG: peptide ABC transporter substrate-binding protein [Steroidobacteraceae bacterium]